ncbi:MAG: ATP-binding protein [Gemmatimonadota bacterium]|jgi:PAS domain S-box-containing protein|nr:ATP-binding protein [Gemmatimonadota bacterium]MDP6801909.1 ATP-binding protein [Gemmatimonadota bacterium]MDP7031635.1 ATP-binding protein [Gemmatimonadota bacterium]
MTDRDQVAVVTPHADLRRSAANWTPLLADRAQLHVYRTLKQVPMPYAGVLLIDEESPGLDQWMAFRPSQAHAGESIVVFAASGPSTRGAILWGSDGTEVLAVMTDILERRRHLAQADEFVRELEQSNDRVIAERRRFARIVVEQSEDLRSENRALSRELTEATRLQDVARFLAAPGPIATFWPLLAEVVGRALGARAAAVCRWGGDSYEVSGAWQIPEALAADLAPVSLDASSAHQPPPSPDGPTCWKLLREDPIVTGLLLLFDSGRDPLLEGEAPFTRKLLALVSDGVRSQASREALRSSQQQNNRILSTLRGGLLKIDARDRVVLANPTLCRILGVPSDDPVGRSLEEVFVDNLHFIPLLRPPRAEADPGPSAEVETYLTRAGHRPVPVSVRTSALPEDDGKRGVLALVTDLSCRVEAEEEVRRADRLAALGRLSAAVAHEIRNPLAGIRTSAEVLLSRLAHSGKDAELASIIVEETDRLDRIVGSLLMFAEPPEPDLEPVDLSSILHRAAHLVGGRAAKRGVTVSVKASPEVPCPLADRDQILQVVLNLTLNGVEASPEGGEVRLLIFDDSTEDLPAVRVVVEDDGPGVPLTIRERVFDPFFSTKSGGTGLGLPVCQHILRRHGGTLRMETSPEGASRATALLPLIPAEDHPRPSGGEPWPTS